MKTVPILRQERRVPARLQSLSALVAAAILSGCGGGGDDPAPQVDPSANEATTQALKDNAANNIGLSLDATLDGASRLTSDDSDTGFDDPSETGVGGVWNDDLQSLVNTSLDLSSEENTTREGTRVTIDPDDAAVCQENFVDMATDDAEFQRCQVLVGKMLVQIDATSDTSGTLTYLFDQAPLAVIGYADNSNSFELNLGTLKNLIDEEAALNPEVSNDSPIDTLTGAIRLSAEATNTTAGEEAGSVSLDITQALNLASADAMTSLSLGTGKIFGMSVNAATQQVTLEIALGALDASVTAESGSASTTSVTNTDGTTVETSEVITTTNKSSIELAGLTATIEATYADAAQIMVRNLGIGDGPLKIALDNAEVANMQLDTFGFTVTEEDGQITLDGALNLSVLLREVLEDNTVSDTLFTLLEMTAPAGTQIVERFNGATSVIAGGPLTYTLTSQDDNGNQQIDQLVLNAGECGDDDELVLVNCE